MAYSFSRAYIQLCIRINGDKPAVIDFWAEWCGPCRFISPVFEKYSDDESLQGVEFYKVDVDAQPDISQTVGIRAVCHIYAIVSEDTDHDFLLLFRCPHSRCFIRETR